MNDLHWKTEKRKVSDLIPYEQNPRQMTEEQVSRLKESLEKFNLVEIPAIDLDNKIIAGHQRLKIMQMIGRGEEEIDVRVPSRKLTDAEFQEYNVRSNKNTGEWDWNILANFDENILLMAGFTKLELSKGFDLIRDVSEDDFDIDAASEEARKNPITKPGEVIELGRHRLMCGDSTKREDVEKLMNGMKADMVLSDPPYGVSYEEKARTILGRKQDATIMNDNLGKEALKTVVLGAFKNIAEFLKDGGSYYICSPQGGELGLMMMMMMEAGIECRHMIVWAKDSPVFSMGRLDYDYQHEPILYGWRGSHQFIGGGKLKTSLWHVPRPKASKLHPTMKPVELAANAIANSSKSEDIVLDLFGGSGTTLIAAEQLGRRCFMMELNPAYCDVIRKRYSSLVNPSIETHGNAENFPRAEGVL